MSRASLVIGALLCLGLAAGLVLPNLGGYALWDPDEARHAEIAREVFTAGDWRGWVLPHLNAQPYHDKPIFQYWLMSAAYAGGGVGEASARLPSAVAMLLTVLVTYVWAATVWDARAAVAVGVVLVTAFEFVALGRYASLDMPLTLWITTGVLAMHRFAAGGRAGPLLVLAGVCAGLGMLTKGLVGPLLVFGIPVLWMTIDGRLRQLLDRRVTWALLAYVAVALPWYALVGVLDPHYLRVFLFQHHLGRFLGSARIALHPKPFWFYVPVLIGGFLPWTALLPAAIRRERDDPAVRFCLLWAATILVFFSLSRGKLGTYILPCFPALALVVGRYVTALLLGAEIDPTTRRWMRAGLWALVAVCVLLVPAALAARRFDVPFVPLSALLAGLAVVPLALALVALLRAGRETLAPLALAAGSVVCVPIFYFRLAPALSAWTSDAHLVAALPAGDTDVVAYRIKPTSFLFYRGAPVPVVATAADLNARLTDDRLTFVISKPRQAAPLVASGVLHPWTGPARHVLYATRPKGS